MSNSTLITREGQRVPEVNFVTRENNAWKTRTSDEIFNNRNVVVFALPGAFTPTCSSTHLPRYNQLAPVFHKEGIDEIICLSVNDAFVMNAWKENQHADNLTLLPDGNGEFTESMGMLVDKSDLGFGKRTWRYSMLVRDGVIEKQFIEPDQPGDPFEVSDADTMLYHINPNAEQPKNVTVISKPGCPHCTRARDLLKSKGMIFEEIELGENGISFSSLTAITGRSATPQIYIDGELVGGADALETLLGH